MSPEGVLAMPFPAPAQFTPSETSSQFSPSPPQAQTHVTPLNSGSEEPDRVATFYTEDRRIRRMISNRESARRSRMRKQRHLEGLRSQLDRLRSENRELANRLGAATHHCLFFCRDNDRLRSEADELLRRVSDIHRILMLQQLQRIVTPPACGGSGVGLASGSELQNLTAPVCGGFMMGNEQTLIA